MTLNPFGETFLEHGLIPDERGGHLILTYLETYLREEKLKDGIREKKDAQADEKIGRMLALLHVLPESVGGTGRSALTSAMEVKRELLLKCPN